MVERDSSIDLIKGIAIVLVMLGHCIGFFQSSTNTLNDEDINSIINSFHMPLFFLLGGVLYKKKLVEDTLKSRFQSIIIPWIILWCLEWYFYPCHTLLEEY